MAACVASFSPPYTVTCLKSINKTRSVFWFSQKLFSKCRTAFTLESVGRGGAEDPLGGIRAVKCGCSGLYVAGGGNAAPAP